MTDELAARVQALEDRLEIHQLFIDYGYLLDQGDLDAYVELFAEDGELLLGPLGKAKGREEVRALMTRAMGAGAGSLHLITSPQVRLDGDTASSTAMWTVLRPDDSGTPTVAMVGRHIDQLVREDGRWRFAQRKGYIDIPTAMAE